MTGTREEVSLRGLEMESGLGMWLRRADWVGSVDERELVYLRNTAFDFQ